MTGPVWMRALLAAGLASVSCTATANDLSNLKLDATASLVSDYRFRGVSLSGNDPAATVAVDVALPHGLFVGGFAAAGAAVRRSDPEADVYGGWRGPAGPVTAALGVTYYAYPGSTRADFTEFFGSVERTLGPVSATLGANYAPDFGALGGDNLYLYAVATAGVPATPLTLRASIGRERGARSPGTGATLDYMAGVEARVGVVTLGIKYVGNNLDRAVIGGIGTTLGRDARDGVIISVSGSF